MLVLTSAHLSTSSSHHCQAPIDPPQSAATSPAVGPATSHVLSTVDEWEVSGWGAGLWHLALAVADGTADLPLTALPATTLLVTGSPTHCPPPVVTYEIIHSLPLVHRCSCTAGAVNGAGDRPPVTGGGPVVPPGAFLPGLVNGSLWSRRCLMTLGTFIWTRGG